MLSTLKLEKHVKGFSNKRRIQIMLLLDQTPGLSLAEIANKLKLNLKTASDHTRRLHNAGLITKKRRLNYITHSLTQRANTTLRFLRRLE